MLITSRGNFDASVHAPLANYMATRYGTKSFVLVGRAAVGEKWKQWTNGNAVILNDEDLHAKAEVAARDWEKVQEIARTFERRYALTYMREVLHQDKGIAAYYLQHSPGSAFAQQEPMPFPMLVALINSYFQTLEDLLAAHPIDLFLTRASGIFNSAAVAIARSRHIPLSWLNHARIGQQMIWMEGPDHGAGLVKLHYPDAVTVSVPELDEIAPPPDTRSARAAAEHDDSVVKLATAVARSVAERLIMRSSDLSRASWPRRLPLRGLIAQNFYRWRTASYLVSRARADARKLQKGRYVLFLLHLDPEYSSSTLARRFNHTQAIIQQLALSLPIGYTLAVKEHVIGLGNRTLPFYKGLSHLPNLVFVDHRLKAIDVARDAAAVATVWGTICLEASLIGVPVICFTENSEYAVLRNVHTVRSPTEIPDVVRDALQPRTDAEILDARREAARFRNAQLALSFRLSSIDLDEYGNRSRSTFGLPEAELAEATAKLLAVYRSGGGTAEPVG
jgi:hypothetical protein